MASYYIHFDAKIGIDSNIHILIEIEDNKIKHMSRILKSHSWL